MLQIRYDATNTITFRWQLGCSLSPNTDRIGSSYENLKIMCNCVWCPWRQFSLSRWPLDDPVVMFILFSNCSTLLSQGYLEQFLWNFPKVNVARNNWRLVDISSGNGLVPSSNKPLLKTMLNKFCDAICWHYPDSKVHGACWHFPDSKVHGVNMEPTWVLSATDGSHVGPMNLAIKVDQHELKLVHFTLGIAW